MLDIRLEYSFRNFDGFQTFFAKLTQANVMSPVVFLTATLMEPEKVLLACGLPVLFDEAFYMSPMRKNLSFKLMFFNDGTTAVTSHRLIMQNSVAAIKQHAPHQRVLIFVMFKWELDLVASWLRQCFPGKLLTCVVRCCVVSVTLHIFRQDRADLQPGGASQFVRNLRRCNCGCD